MNLKLTDLFAAYATENGKDDYFNRVQNEGTMIEAGHAAGSRYAEPFEASKIVFEQCRCGCGSVALARNSARRHGPLADAIVILVVAAHNDDEVLGPGATLAALLR